MQNDRTFVKTLNDILQSKSNSFSCSKFFENTALFHLLPKNILVFSNIAGTYEVISHLFKNIDDLGHLSPSLDLTTTIINDQLSKSKLAK
jgi:hypothetical protein